MKKLVSIIATLIFTTGVTMASQPTGDDNNQASHRVGITIPTVALVDVEGANGEASSINLSPSVSGLEAGEAVNFSSATDNSLWLNYTSIVEGGILDSHGNNSNTRSISARLSDGSLPGGVNLLLTVGNISSGNGAKGHSAASDKVLTTSAQDVVTGIGTCYTETGNNKGHQLTYKLNMDNGNYQALTAGSYEVTVQYTISEDN
jgi:hypothetical protein